jgi:hypothetical protein
VATPGSLWAPDKLFHTVALSGATDPEDGAVAIAITGVKQDEPIDGTIDAVAGASPASVGIRAERAGGGDGRVYVIAFTATDADGASCTGTASVGVPHNRGRSAALDSGATHDSFGG